MRNKDREYSKGLDSIMEMAEIERNRILSEDFATWHKGVLAEFLQCLKANHPDEYVSYYCEWDSILRGN